jgi:hypothetical protein
MSRNIRNGIYTFAVPLVIVLALWFAQTISVYRYYERVAAEIAENERLIAERKKQGRYYAPAGSKDQ